MCCFIRLMLLAGLVGVLGCRSGDRSGIRPRAGGAEPHVSRSGPAVLPSPDDIRSVAPAFATAVTEWRAQQAASERVLILGPTVVGLEGATAQTAAELGALFGEAVNARLDSRTRFAATPAAAPDEVADADAVFDARLSWEPAGKRSSKNHRLVLELVNPRDGRTVYTTSQSIVPAAARVSTLSRTSQEPTTLPTQPVAVGPSDSPTADTPPTPAKTSAKPVPGPSTPLAERGPGTEEAFTAWSVPRTTESYRDWAVGDGRGAQARLPVLRRGRGTIYFANGGLADRVALVRDEAQALEEGAMRLRLVLYGKKGKKTLSLRCEFYDSQGASAGTVSDVSITVREGRSSTVAMVSRRPATRYVLFIEED